VLNRFLHTVNLWNWDLTRHETLLAVSGGADSVVLARLFQAAGFPFAMAHVNYGLRGDDSKADEQLVRDLAIELGVELFVYQANMHGEDWGRNSLQMQARELRYQFFDQIREQHPGRFRKIAIAHHATDNLEHFFLYLLRNNQEVAWRGILYESGDVIRPMLAITKSEIYDFASVKGWNWREDLSNQKTEYLRNKIRHYILPFLDENAEKEFSSISLKKQQNWLENREKGEEFWVNSIKYTQNGIFVPREFIQNLEMQNYVTSQFLGFGFSQDNIQKMLSVDVKAGTIFQSKRNFVEVSGEQLEGEEDVWNNAYVGRAGIFVVLSNQELRCGEVMIDLPEVDGKAIIDLQTCELEVTGVVMQEPSSDAKSVDEILLFEADFPLEVRPWNMGDKIQIGRGKKQKVSDLFTNLKVENYEKWMYPIIINSEGEILCVLGLRNAWRERQDRNVAGHWRMELRWKY